MRSATTTCFGMIHSKLPYPTYQANNTLKSTSLACHLNYPVLMEVQKTNQVILPKAVDQSNALVALAEQTSLKQTTKRNIWNGILLVTLRGFH